MSASKFGTDKRLPKDFLSENNGFNGAFDKWLRFHFLLLFSLNYFQFFFLKRVAMCIFVSNNWI